MKKIWGFILATLAIIGTYIGVNQFTNRTGGSTPKPEQEQYIPPKRPEPKTTQPGGSRLK